MHAVVSIHDVMPNSLNAVEALTDALSGLDNRNVALLVVPGLEWSLSELERLRTLQNDGFVLAGHGWHHKAQRIDSWKHRIHAALLSRDVAEHLALDDDTILALMHRCHQWFCEHEFHPPDLYVPPAWAMGCIRKNRLSASPFRYFETTSGLFDSQSMCQVNLPLAGFEADTVSRAAFLRGWNRLNRTMSSAIKPLRLSLHPHDPELLLGRCMHNYISDISTAVSYRSIFH